MNKRTDISDEEITRMYLVDYLSTCDIAKVTGLGVTTVMRRLKKLGVFVPNRRTEICEKELYRLYVEEGMSISEMAEHLDLNERRCG